jgi:hypothetical protein
MWHGRKLRGEKSHMALICRMLTAIASVAKITRPSSRQTDEEQFQKTLLSQHHEKNIAVLLRDDSITSQGDFVP